MVLEATTTNYLWHRVAEPFLSSLPGVTRRRRLKLPDLRRERSSPLPLPPRWLEGGGTSFLRLVVRVRINLLWCVVGMVGATSGQINLPQLYSHIGVDLYGGVSELMAPCACRSFRLAPWSSRRSSDLARSVSRCVAGLHWRPGRGGFSGTRMLVRRW
jgi:hypothetical protein